jgi:hypothetical protein
MTDYSARLAKLGQLAAADVAAGELAAGARRAIGELWVRRAEGELATADTFAGIHRDCVALGLSDGITSLTARAADDERFHGELSLLMAAHYLGAPVPAPGAAADALRFDSCVAEVAPALRIVLHCALNETVAVAYLRRCYQEAASELVRAALRELLADEVDHSRVGWAFIASVAGGPVLHESLRRELPALLALVSEAWSTPSSAGPHSLGHGVLDDEATRAVTQEALRALVLPGLARFGLVPRGS